MTATTDVSDNPTPVKPLPTTSRTKRESSVATKSVFEHDLRTLERTSGGTGSDL